MMDSGRAQGIPAGVIEILNRSGQVLQRVAYSGGELSVGRAYDNDIIVSDPYVCAHHLAITGKDGIVIARDLDSVNGTYIGRERDRVEEATLGDESLIHFGHSQMRFRKAQSPVAASWRDTSRHGLLAWFGKPWMLVATVMLALLAMTMDNLLDSGESMGAGELAGQLLYPLIGILVWAGFWSLINRIISHSANFHVHLGITCAGIVGMLLSFQLISLAGFAFAWDPVVPWLRLAGRITVLAFVVYAHLRYATHGREWVQAVVAGFSGILLFGTPTVGDILDQSEFNNLPDLNPLLKPPAFQVRPGVSVESFFDDARSLKIRLDESAARDGQQGDGH